MNPLYLAKAFAMLEGPNKYDDDLHAWELPILTSFCECLNRSVFHEAGRNPVSSTLPLFTAI